MKKPGKSDPSRPREDGYDYKRDFYRSAQVADDYDFHRFSSNSLLFLGRHILQSTHIMQAISKLNQ